MGLGLARPGGPQRPALMRKQTWVAARGEAAGKQKQLSLGRGAQSSSMCVCVGEVHVYMGTSGQVPTKCQLLLWQLDSNCFVLSIVAQICYPTPGTCPRPSKLVSASAQLPAGSS